MRKKSKKKIAYEIFVKHLPWQKNYLYKLILKSLRSYYADISLNAKLKDILRDVEILYKKGLYDQCRTLLDWAKKTSIATENDLTLLEVFHWEMELVRANVDISRLENYIQKDHIAEKKILERYRKVLQYKLLYTTFFTIMTREKDIRSKNVLAKINQIIESPLFKDESNAVSFQEKNYLYNLKSSYFRAIGNHPLSYEYRKKLTQLWEAHPNQIQHSPSAYINVINNLMIGQGEVRDFKAFFKTIDRLKSFSTKSESIKAGIFKISYSAEISIYRITGEYEKGISLVKTIEDGLVRYRNKIEMYYLLTFYFEIACNYFGHEDYDDASYWLSKILDNDNTELRVDYYSVSYILMLIIHYEIGNQDILEYLVKSTYRFLYKKNILYKFESTVLKFIRKVLPKILNQKELITAFTQLKKELILISKDPLEKKILVYFDFITWLESKIEKRSFAEIAREKSANKD